MPIITFMLQVETDLEGEFAFSEEDQKALMADIEELAAKRNLSLHDSTITTDDA